MNYDPLPPLGFGSLPSAYDQVGNRWGGAQDNSRFFMEKIEALERRVAELETRLSGEVSDVHP